ncbi:hypothetical protein APY04_0041 [Hyphomicrobium sulfonivorans]|uniref:Uncharacterized protein n=1 Tax=Hyphomicrobium sulfonivorans TaxID=121290 RepID=A0A109BQM0_HYPSL|nr:hypothetical protein APY04_0041 [Hyphomicrobium sulfonivorans]
MRASKTTVPTAVGGMAGSSATAVAIEDDMAAMNSSAADRMLAAARI